MFEIEHSNKYTKLLFKVSDSGRITLVFAGNHSINYLNKESTFVEIEISEDDHLGSHCFKQCNTPFGKNSKYKNHYINKEELVIVTNDAYLEVESHFKLYETVSGYSQYNVVKNISSNPIHLEYVASIYLYTLGQKVSPTFKDMNLYYASSSWHVESQWKKESFIEAKLFNANDRLTMNKFVLNNTGSWSTKEHLPMVGVENTQTNTFILGQVENNGSWHIELGDNENQYYLSMSGPDMMDNQWSKCLYPNESFISVQASLVFASSFESSIQEMTKLRRYLIDKDNIDYKTQPIIFNDFMYGTWDLSTEELIKPMVDSASKAGVELFVLDAGWFAKTSGWGNYIGEYKEYSPNFPTGGLNGLCDYIRNKGMKVGLWFEIENVGYLCPELEAMPEDYFMHINGSRIKRNSRYCLNLCNKGAFSWAINKISDAIKKYSLDYIKIDYNLDLGPGNDDYSKFLGEGLLEQNRKVIEFIKELHRLFPNLIIENCASGGQRLDYEMLKYTQIVSTSDLENYYYYPYISGSVLAACLPEQASIWSYPVCNDNKKFDITDEVVIFNMASGIVGRLTLSSKLYKLTNTQFELVKEGVALAKSINDFRKRALPIYPNGVNGFFNKSVCYGLSDGSRTLLFVFNMLDESQEVEIDLSKYNAKTVEQAYPLGYKVDCFFTDNTLKIRFPEGKMGRVFEIK